MKAKINLEDTDHDFDKINLFTQTGGYDTYRCKCGLEGKRNSLSPILNITGKASLIAKCPNAKPKEAVTVERVRITNFEGCSSEFKNLTNGSEHDVVACPKEHQSKYGSDVWVMGMTEPVRLLEHEYENI